MTAAEVTSIAINKHSQVQGTAEVSYWNSFILAKVLHNVFVHNYATVFTQHNYT